MIQQLHYSGSALLSLLWHRCCAVELANCLCNVTYQVSATLTKENRELTIAV